MQISIEHTYADIGHVYFYWKAKQGRKIIRKGLAHYEKKNKELSCLDNRHHPLLLSRPEDKTIHNAILNTIAPFIS